MVLLWLQRSLELLWLLTIVLVPLAFLRIADSPLILPFPMETAKIAIFRALVGLMAALWLIEWGLRGGIPLAGASASGNALDKRWLFSLWALLAERPARWIIVAVMFYLAVVLISTLLSQSPSVSLWGRVPATDTTSAYNAVCFVLLFSVIVTHFKTSSQLWRLLAAITGVGVLVGGYAVLQYYGLDFLMLNASGGARVSSTVGNPIFASSVLLITISVSLTVAVLTLVDPVKTARFWQRAGLWSLVLTVQLAGTMFTLSRGPWGGTVFALVVLLLLIAVFVGRSALGRACLVLGLAAALAAFVVLVPTGLGWYEPAFADLSALEQIEGRFTSVQRETTEGSLGQRIGIWRSSWLVITERPWFEFEDSTFSALRPIVGYGPDTFSAVFLLGSLPVGPKLFPLETTHGHNYLLHHWVELGALGLLASLGLLAVPILAGGWEVWRNRQTLPYPQKVLAIGLVSVLLGRFVEQMFGVAKVSDSILFWVVLAVLVCLPALAPSQVPPPRSESIGARPVQRRSRRNRGGAAAIPSIRDSGIYWRFAIVCLLIGGIVALTWAKNFNNLRALNQVAGLNQAFVSGNLNASVEMLRRAKELAPDVYHYHSNLGAVYSAYQSATAQEPECSFQAGDATSYELCLAQKVADGYANAVAQSPGRWRSRLDSAEAELELALLTQDVNRATEAVRLYQETAEMAPYSWKLRNQLAQTLNTLGDPEASLLEIDRSLAITGDTPSSAEAMLLSGLAYGNLGQPERAINSYTEAIRHDPEYALAYNNLGIAYARAGQYPQAVDSYDMAILLDPEYAPAHNNRGAVHVRLGQYELAIADYGEAIRIDPQYADVYFNRGVVYAISGQFAEARQDLERAAELGADRAILENAINELEASAGETQSGEQ